MTLNHLIYSNSSKVGKQCEILGIYYTMAWLQSSFTNHQLLGESGGSSHRKGYKVGSLNKNTDPDKSDTPLLQDSSPFSPKKVGNNSGWFEDDGTTGPKKQGMLLGKSSFLSTSFFDRSSINSKLKPLAVSRDSSQSSAGQTSKVKEDKKLLSGEKQETPQYEEDEDDDSEDEWCIPHTSGGYQKVRSGAD
ncbi:uncharacterized protein TNCT_283951 [Trichonephila clavata]|uniref:Uncharacterized protein n=1 Tax=Trichonephila clavata TaxID=2740835 RepID=A0A8X6L8S5_TRICU|nr:uncharacterized protein TNCT_283951 [Trichonephila clavata]